MEAGSSNRSRCSQASCFKTTEVAKDGRSVRISPDGRYAAYETGQRQSLVTRIIALADPTKTIAEIRGTNFIFSPSPNAAAFLRVADTPETAALRKEIETLVLRQPRPTVKPSRTNSANSPCSKQRAPILIYYNIATKKERRQKIEGFLKSSPAFSADGREVYFVGAKETDTASNEIYASRKKARSAP